MMSTPQIGTPSSIVQGTLQYLSSRGEGTVATYYATQAGDAAPAEHDGQFSHHKVSIHNARQDREADGWSIDVQGFRLLSDKATQPGQDFYNDNDLAATYNPQVEQLLLRHLPGSRRVVVFDHTRRASSSQLRTETQAREPSAIVHNDYTEKSAYKRLRDILGEDDDDIVAGKRFVIVNVWRSIAGIVETWPMAFCDSTTVDPSVDLVSVKRVAKDRTGEIQLAVHQPEHRWYYFPQMTPDEVLLFKTFDSDTSSTANRFTIHSAFEDPTSAVDAAPRQSLETRLLSFFSDSC